MRSYNGKKLFRIWDVLVLAIVLLLIALTVYYAISPKRGDFAEVYLNGKLYATISLDRDSETVLEHLTVVVRDGKVFVKDADCPDKICEERGAISKRGQTIVCLPARVVIKITGKGEVEAIT